MSYVDAAGQVLNAGDCVSLSGSNGKFEIVSIRPERVAVIRNQASGYVYTSSVPLSRLTRRQYEEAR